MTDPDPVVRHSRAELLRAALAWRLAEVLRESAGAVEANLDVVRQCADDLAQLYPGGLSEASRDLEEA